MLLLACACSEPAQQTSSSGGSVNDGGSGDAELDAPSAQCNQPHFSQPDQSQQFERLHANVVDQNGTPVSVESAQICGFDVCVALDVADDGEVDFDGVQSLRGPAFKLGFGLRFAKFAFRLSEPETDLGTTVAVRLPSFEEAAPLQVSPTSAFTSTSNDVTLTLEPNTVVEFDALTYRSTERGFRAVVLPASRHPHAVGPALADAVVVALSPGETTFCPNARLSVPNIEGWPSGAALEFLLHGASIEQTSAPYGGWEVVSSGAVTADGSRLETSEGEGLPALSAVAIRRSL